MVYCLNILFIILSIVKYNLNTHLDISFQTKYYQIKYVCPETCETQIGFNQFWITENSLTTCNSPRQCTKYKQDRL